MNSKRGGVSRVEDCSQKSDVNVKEVRGTAALKREKSGIKGFFLFPRTEDRRDMTPWFNFTAKEL